MSGDVHTEARTALRSFLHDILHDVVIITEHSRRQTATVMDVLLALKRRGRCVSCNTWYSAYRCTSALQGPHLDSEYCVQAHFVRTRTRRAYSGCSNTRPPLFTDGDTCTCLQAAVWVWSAHDSWMGSTRDSAQEAAHPAGEP